MPVPGQGGDETAGRDGDDNGQDDGQGTDDDALPADWTVCSTPAYTIEYPADWRTNETNDLVGPCEVFDPEPIDVPEQPRDRDLDPAVQVYVDAVAFDDRDPDETAGEVLVQERTTVAGSDALLVERRSNGTTLLPEGERSRTWTVDLGDDVLVATTSTVGDTDYERDSRILDHMVTERLTLGPAPVDAPATTGTSEQEPDGRMLTVTDVDVAGHAGFDRIVFELAGDGTAGWLVEYSDQPRSQGSGNPVEVQGDAALRIVLRSIAYPGDAPAEPRDGPERITGPGTQAVTEVVDDSLYEGFHAFFVGLDEERPYRVQRLEDPQRVVVDVETG